MYSIKGISSLNLRTRRNKPDLKSADKIVFRCSFCKSNKQLSKDTSVFVKISYSLHEKDSEYILCERCADVFVDMVRFGPRVCGTISSWERCSRLIRIFTVQENMYCFSCLGRQSTHVSVRYDDLMCPGNKDCLQNKRVCARCAITFLEMMGSKKMKTMKLPFYIANSLYGGKNYELFEIGREQ